MSGPPSYPQKPETEGPYVTHLEAKPGLSGGYFYSFIIYPTCCEYSWPSLKQYECARLQADGADLALMSQTRGDEHQGTSLKSET